MDIGNTKMETTTTALSKTFAGRCTLRRVSVPLATGPASLRAQITPTIGNAASIPDFHDLLELALNQVQYEAKTTYRIKTMTAIATGALSVVPFVVNGSEPHCDALHRATTRIP